MNKTREPGHPALYKYDFADVRVNQGLEDEMAFLKEFKERVLSLYRQEWDNSIRTKECFTAYTTFKSSLSLAPYLNELKDITARNFLTIIWCVATKDTQTTLL